ncbi:MAG: ABC transporter substrate-binding protein, partial [Chloroflexota bacterium]
VGALVAAAFGGCGRGIEEVVPAAQAPRLGGRVTFMHYRKADEQPMIQQMVDAFVARHPDVTAEVVPQPDQFYQKLQVLLAAGTPPDVFYAKPESYGFYVQRGHLASLSPLIKRDRYDVTDFFPGSVSQYQIRSQQYVLPRGYAPNTFYVNLELFKQEGVPLPAFAWKDTAWTWPRLVDVTRQLTKGEGDQVTQHGLLPPTAFRGYASFIYSNGGELWDAQGKECRITQPPTVEALQFIADLIHKHRVAPTPADLKQMKAKERWINRKAALGQFSASRFGEWRRVGLDFDVAVPPKGAAPTRIVAGGGVGYALAAEANARDLAWELLKWMNGKEMQLLEVQLGNVFPPRRSIANSPAFLKPGEQPAHAALAVQAAERHVLVTPPFTRWDELLAVMSEHLATLWNGQESARSIAAKIKPPVDALLRESPTPA